MADTLTSGVRDLLLAAEAAAATPRARATLAESRRRLDGPLRVAIAGKVKAGKSTLLNALLGEGLAPTDAGECTRIVTWYRRAEQPRVVVHTATGARPRPYDRTGGAIRVDLGAPTSEVDHLEVEWPTSRLAGLTLIDTPGIASLSTDLSAETYRVLSPEDDRPSVADAVVYLLRHAHASDVRFLESFHDDELARGTPMNAVGVLARADEIGSCRLDALDDAERVGRRYQHDDRLRRLCPVVVPVSGLLGLAGETLRDDEYRALAALAAGPTGEVTALLLTADRFAHRPSSLPVSEVEREHLVDRLGLFGVRLSVELIRSGAAPSAAALGAALVDSSGLTRLRGVLLAQFTSRSRILKARSALAAVAGVLEAGGCRDADALHARVEGIATGAHEFVEVRTLTALRSDALDVGNRREELERLLGAGGHDAATRLGLDGGATPDDVRHAARDAHVRWQRVAEHPLSDRPVQAAARVAVRTVEGLLVELGRGDRADRPVR